MLKLRTLLASAAMGMGALAAASANATVTLIPTETLQSYSATSKTVIDFDYSLGASKKLLSTETYVGPVFVTSQSFGPFTGSGVFDFGSIGAGITIDYQLAAVPEPAAWSLMFVGIGGVGTMLRRRQSLVASS